MHRFLSCTNAFATERGKKFNNLLQWLTFNVFSLEKESAGSWLCHNAPTLGREYTSKDFEAGNAASATDDSFGYWGSKIILTYKP